MKNLKKINRVNLKSITGGRPPAISECYNCGCPVGTKSCYYKNGNGGGGGCADIQCVY
ncbi:bacteriocin-like protein [Elizabethkingia meningoseptica]|uniref:bacteriocin-like protein n=1 Tax=Elizabethkingia meningoseptica TaxID=238 RepID=UPI0038928835